MTGARVLIWERIDADDRSVPWLRAQGLDVVLGRPNEDPDYRRYEEGHLIADAAGCAALLGSGGARVTRAVIEALPGLKVISKVGVGVDNIDVAAAGERGIVVCHTPDDGDAAAVAEHAFALMLALLKQLPVWPASFVRDGGWRSAQTFTSGLAGCTVGVVGGGRIGRALMQRFAGWEVELLLADPALHEAPAGARLVPLPELLARSDVVSLHCPPPPGGAVLLGAAQLAAMKPGAVLVNTARAALVDTAALAAALHRGHLGGAAVDVFAPEPPRPDDPLLHAPQVILTPHVASWTRAGYLRRRQQAAENVVLVLSGRPGAQVVNRKDAP
jgi:D-3-phosphoglycerate dehydrogenase